MMYIIKELTVILSCFIAFLEISIHSELKTTSIKVSVNEQLNYFLTLDFKV